MDTMIMYVFGFIMFVVWCFVPFAVFSIRRQARGTHEKACMLVNALTDADLDIADELRVGERSTGLYKRKKASRKS